MRASTAKRPMPRRWRGKGSLTILAALFALAGVQVLGPAPAVAMDDAGTGTGSTCVAGEDGVYRDGTGEYCDPFAESGGPGGEPTGTPDDDEIIGEVVEVEGTAPDPPLQPRPPRGIGDGDLLAQASPPAGGGVNGGHANPSSAACAFWMKDFRELKRQLRGLSLDRKSQQDALGVIRGWKSLAPSDEQVWEPTRLRPQKLEEVVRKRLRELRTEEIKLQRDLRDTVDFLRVNNCSVDVM
jgi:hypothetical protein